MTDAEMRLNGIYRQRQQPFHMMRIKLAGGVFSCRQARVIADLSDTYARGMLHLTTRCSIELHWLEEDALTPIQEALGAVGLTSRGACGGAVRGVSVSGASGGRTSSFQYVLANYLQQHFTGDARYEGLPKKFKVGIQSGDHEIACKFQDVGIVLLTAQPSPSCDIWVAGGLGREPQEGFLLASAVSLERLVPLIDAVIGVYREMAPLGKRVKHVVRETGEDSFSALVMARAAAIPDLPFPELHEAESPDTEVTTTEIPVFAGELSTAALRSLVDISAAIGTERLFVTPNQNIAVEVASPASVGAVMRAAEAAALCSESKETVFRVCPGNHECRVGLSATRDIAQQVVAAMPEAARDLTWAISGCGNSCSQPQAADVGIITVRLARDDAGGQAPLFDLCRKTSPDRFGTATAQAITLNELLALVAKVEKP